MTVLQLTATKRRCIYIYSLVYGALQKIKIWIYYFVISLQHFVYFKWSK
jgi:hypothetical protein